MPSIDSNGGSNDDSNRSQDRELAMLAYETASQANTFGLLARMWIAEIDTDFLAELQDEPLRTAYESVGGFVPSEPENGSNDLVESLAIEFCACFLGPKGHLPPHQSVVSQSRFQGDCLESMKKYASVIGQPEGIFAAQPMLDHAGVQLHLMQRILESMSAAIEDPTKPPSTRESLSELLRAFFAEHLAWLNDYCAVAAAKTESEFYSGLFRVTRLMLGGEE